MENVAVMTLTNEDGYSGLGARVLLRAWQAIVVSDVLGDIRSVLRVAAEDREAERTLVEVWGQLFACFEGTSTVRLATALSSIARRLAAIPLRAGRVTSRSSRGEIFVRREEFSRKNIVDYLEDHGFAVRVAPVAEYVHYSNYVVNTGLGERHFSWRDRIRLRLLARIEGWQESHIRRILARSRLCNAEVTDIVGTIDSARHLISEHYRGETILTVGLAMREILRDSCGVISLGPFGCMPSRVAESILRREMRPEGKSRVPGWGDSLGRFQDLDVLPFMAVETDGNPYTQIVEGLDAFVSGAAAPRKNARRPRPEGSNTTRVGCTQYWRAG
jgi:predicted nucleotide-binding protein (sugar kinase/HSP70/actin superfamily)